jgi:plasmid stabilization system protein ParE
MSKKIEWSPRAKKDYLKTLKYIQEQWGDNTVK